MNILSIESSCDETAAAILKDGHTLLSNVVVSQIDIFKAYGGVIPEVAARSHLEAILPVVHQALDQAFPGQSESSQWDQIDAISVTHTPGLLGSLLIGTLAARTLAILHDKPFYPVHHLKSHIYAAWLSPSQSAPSQENPAPAQLDSVPSFPILALVISGGHTQIIRMTHHNHFEIIGTTRDDAVGECFDKVAKILGLPYPGGPSIAQAALGSVTFQTGETIATTPGDPHKYRFPHPKITDASRSSSAPNLDFSFSGLKTAVLRSVQSELGVPISFPSHDLPAKIASLGSPASQLSAGSLKPAATPQSPAGSPSSAAAHFVADFAASFQQTAIDILLEKLDEALEHFPDTKSIVIAGGVSANSLLREQATHHFSTPAPESSRAPLSESKNADHLKVFFPEKSFSGDNAAMVAAATYYEIQSGVQPSDPYSLDLQPRSPIF